MQRWSPRSFEPAPLPSTDLLRVLEAARWAPSAYNVQPWRFVYSTFEDEYWNATVSVLDEFNQRWASRAGALVGLLSQHGATHRFDAGAAWAQLALQATAMGYAAHAIAGFDEARARTVLHVPDDYDIPAFVALGRPASAAALPDDLRAREVRSGRRPLTESVFHGEFSRTAADPPR